MFFTAAKVFWLLVKPSNFVLLALLAGLAALLLRRTGLGVALVALAAAPLAAVALVPLGSWLLVPLENRFRPPEPLPDDVDGVVVLGGAPQVSITAARGQVTLSDAAERLTTMVEFARRYPDARVVFTGGSASLFGAPTTEAVVVRDFLAGQGLAADRVTLEGGSRDTYENAVLSKRLVGPEPGERWLLVTSAYHMPRSVGVFRAVGWPGLIPYPVDHRTTGGLDLEADSVFNTGDRLADLDIAAREWIGLLAYRLMGRTDALLPGPAP